MEVELQHSEWLYFNIGLTNVNVIILLKWNYKLSHIFI